MKISLLSVLFLIRCDLIFAQWISQSSGFVNSFRGINQIVTLDQNTAWATAYDGSGLNDTIQEFTRTTDGGATWLPGSVNVAPSFYEWACLAAIDDQTAWAMFYDASQALHGFIYKTNDGGTGWIQQGAGLFQGSTSFGDVIYFWDANTGVAIGDPFNGEFEIYRTTDGGSNWSPVAATNIPDPLAGEYGLTGGFSVGIDGSLWFLTNKGRVYKTTDQGQTWSAFATGLSGQLDIIACKDANHAWVRKAGSMKRTDNGGNSWSSVTPSSGHFFRQGLAFVPKTFEVLVSTGVNQGQLSDQGSSYSLDGGSNWFTIDTLVQHNAVAFFDHLTGWSGGFNEDSSTGGIFKYGGAFIADESQDLHGQDFFILYPNPGDGLFYFSLDASNSQPVTIRVTDVMGRTVFSKCYSNASQIWLSSVDIRDQGRGIYFLELSNQNIQINRKLLVR